MKNDIKAHKHIIFCDEHYNSLGIVRSLGERGILSFLIIINNKMKLTSKSKYVKGCYYVDNLDEGYKLLISIFGNETKKPFLYTSDDTKASFLDEHYSELRDKFYFFNAGNNGKVNYYMNKENIGNLALKHGLNFLKAVKVKKGEIPSDLDYPVITKAIDSKSAGWKADMHICNNEEELKKAFDSISSSEVLVQKYIYKKNEYCMEGISVNKGKDVFISIASTYNYILNNSYSPYMTVENFNRDDIKHKLEAMLAEIGYEGIYEIEFLIDQDDTLYFGEINFRNSTWSYASSCAGMNLPYLWAEGMIQGYIDKDAYKPVKNGFTAMVELSDLKHRVKERKYSIIKWIRDFKKADCKYYVGKKDLKPIFSMLLSKLDRRMIK